MWPPFRIMCPFFYHCRRTGSGLNTLARLPPIEAERRVARMHPGKVFQRRYGYAAIGIRR